MPKVSILIPCYNAERWVAHAIQSALDQTHSDKEVIVVDDGSTDGSLDVIRSFEGQIRYVTGRNLGGNVARNQLLEMADGEWLQYLDADDYLLPDKISQQLGEAAGLDADVLWSPSIMEYWDKDATVRQVTQTLCDEDPWVALLWWRLPQTGAALWRKTKLQEVGCWKPEQPCCQEHELYLRLLRSGASFRFCKSARSVYRHWSNQSVCKRDPMLTNRQRVAITSRARDHLDSTNSLSTSRERAWAAATLACARSIFHQCPETSIRIADDVHSRVKLPRLPKEDCFPAIYRIAYSVLGFGGAERLAGLSRRLREGLRSGFSF